MTPASVVVASAVDADFLPLVEVVAKSIATAALSDRTVNYHVFYCGPESRVSRRLQGSRRGVVTIHLHSIANPWQRFGKVGRFPAISLLRLSLANLLPDESRVIYLDADLVVLADIGELFDTALEGRPAGAVVDRYVLEQALRVPGEPKTAEFRTYLDKVVGLDSDDLVRDYRQAGVLLIDLDAWRALRFAERAMELLEAKASQLRYADQCLLNMLLRGQMTTLDPRWNVTPLGLASPTEAPTLPELEDYSRLQRSDPRIVHFTGSKPWARRRLRGADYWWRSAWASGQGGPFALRLVGALAISKLRGLARRVRSRRLTTWARRSIEQGR